MGEGFGVRLMDSELEADRREMAGMIGACSIETEDSAIDPVILKKSSEVLDTPAVNGYALFAHPESDKSVVCGLITGFKTLDPALGGFIHHIGTVYVKPEFRKKGLFRKLFDEYMTEAKKDPLGKQIRLEVDHGNEKAIKAYEAVGMSDLPSYYFVEKPLTHYLH